MDTWVSVTVTTASLISAVAGGLFAWFQTKTTQSTLIETLRRQLSSAEQEREKAKTSSAQLAEKVKSGESRIKELDQLATKFQSVRDRLKRSVVVHHYERPVVLVGPRSVGKTSLLLQWHAPWDRHGIKPTAGHQTAYVPVYDYKQPNTQPHFADPEVMVGIERHLGLRVHDFPGELAAQKRVKEVLVEETETLRQRSGTSLGVVLICMFDAAEAKTGLSKETQNYYNGDLFRSLRDLVALSHIQIDRLVLVFNKYDTLRVHSSPAADDMSLLRECVDKFSAVYAPLRGACNPEKVCEVFTVLSRQDMHLNNRDAPIVLGEAARVFVSTIAGPQVFSMIISQAATTVAASKFLA